MMTVFMIQHYEVDGIDVHLSLDKRGGQFSKQCHRNEDDGAKTYDTENLYIKLTCKNRERDYHRGGGGVGGIQSAQP